MKCPNCQLEIRANKNKNSTNGEQFLYASVRPETYDFIRQYTLFSLGVSIEMLIEDFKRMRDQLAGQPKSSL